MNNEQQTTKMNPVEYLPEESTGEKESLYCQYKSLEFDSENDSGNYFENENEETPILTEHNIPDEVESNASNRYFYMLVFVASLGGFLFGYDTGVISGAMIPLKRVFNLTNIYQEVIVAVAIGGAILGALLSGIINDWLGRRPVLIIASCIFTIGSVVLGVANGFIVLVVGRVIIGIGIGLASMTVPVYMAELSPPTIRGKIVTVYTLFITGGQFVASVMNGAFSYLKHDSWRYMLGISGVPSLFMFIGCLFIPESPRWLIQKGKVEQARKVLQTVCGKTSVNTELQSIIDGTKNESGISLKNSLKKILYIPSTRRALILGCGLQFIQQMAGINTVMYYSASIIQLAGISEEKTIIWLAAIVAFGNCFFTLVSFYLIERIGRRKLTLCSVFGVVFGLSLLAVTFFLLDHRSLPVTYKSPSQYTKECVQYNNCHSCITNNKCGFCYVLNDLNVYNGSCLAVDISHHNDRSSFCGSHSYIGTHKGTIEWSDSVCPSTYAWLAVVSMIFYLSMFAPGLGPMPWTINAEIYPLWARNAGTSTSTATNWVMNLLVSLTFLSLLDYLTRTGAFIFYAVFTLLGFVFLYFLLPETKGRKLEEISELFKGSPSRAC